MADIRAGGVFPWPFFMRRAPNVHQAYLPFDLFQEKTRLSKRKLVNIELCLCLFAYDCVSIDYGILNPFSAGLWAVYRGVSYRWKEYYYSGREKGHQRTDEEHYKAVGRLAGNLPIELIVIDPSASSFKATINRHGKFSVANAINDVLPGISTVSSLLAAGRLKIGSACTDCIKEFSLYAWDSDGDDGLKEEVVKENDHAMDDTRYFCCTILQNEFDWLNWG